MAWSRLEDHGGHVQQPDATAVTTALWRAAHVLLDDAPHVIEDHLGLELARDDVVLLSAGFPLAQRGLGGLVDDSWLSDPRMSDLYAPWRASVVARARFVEDLVIADATDRAVQYVILGAGLDTFALRRSDLSTNLRVFEVDEPGTQEWKRHRFEELGIAIPSSLRFVPVDFESGQSWADAVTLAGLKPDIRVVVASCGVSQYISATATVATMSMAARLAAETTFVCTFMVPIELGDPADRELQTRTESGAASRGHPWISSFSPMEFAAMAHEAGFAHVDLVSAADLASRYFGGRSDGLRPSSFEHLLVATTTPRLAC